MTLDGFSCEQQLVELLEPFEGRIFEKASFVEGGVLQRPSGFSRCMDALNE